MALLALFLVCMLGVGKLVGVRASHRHMQAQLADHAEGWQCVKAPSLVRFCGLHWS